MVKEPIISVDIDSRKKAAIGCPVDGKGFSRVLIRSTNPDILLSIHFDTPLSKSYAIDQTGQLFDFSSFNNTVPRTLYFYNSGDTSARVFVFVEEVGSNPV